MKDLLKKKKFTLKYKDKKKHFLTQPESLSTISKS